MNRLTGCIMVVYSHLLAFYPPAFRAEFGREMQAVFGVALEEARQRSPLRWLALFGRELRDWPPAIWREHLRERKGNMKTDKFSAKENSLNTNERQPGTWVAAFLAGLPHLLVGLLIGGGKMLGDSNPVNQPIMAGVGITLGILVMAMLVIAWRGGWPLWSASWYLYGTWVILALINLVIERLHLEASWRYSNALLFLWFGFCLAGYVSLLIKSKLHGLVAIAFIFPFLGIQMLEFIPNAIEGWLALGLGVTFALTCGIGVRLGDYRASLGLVLGVNALAALSLAYVGEYQAKDLPQGISAHIPQFGSFLAMVGLNMLVALGIIAIPFALRGLWNLGRQKLKA